MTYRLKPIEAVQFDPQVEPWPDGISASENSSTGYIFVGINGQCEIGTGDYVIPGTPLPSCMAAQAFEALYESAE